MSAALAISFLLMGFTFTVTQGLFIREFLVVFAGNELSIGLLLANWLLLEALGSGLLGRLAERAGRNAMAAYAALQVTFSLSLPLALSLTYSVRQFLGAIPGEGLGFLPILYSSLLILMPLGLVDGAMFTFGCQANTAVVTAKTSAIGRVYIYEAVGAILGGLVFTFLFIPYFSSVEMALILIVLNLASAASLLAFSPARRSALIPVALMVIALYLLLSPQAKAWQEWLARHQWAGYDLRYYRHSIYGNIAVTRQEEQYTFYENGLPVLTAPVPDITLVEELGHLPLLFQGKPRRVLIVSGGVGGVLAEVLKHPVEVVDYAELDPLLIAAVREFPTHLTSRELGDPRVRLQYRDGRLLVREKSQVIEAAAAQGYDVILVNLPYPSTLQLNRFYTREFFAQARAILSRDGVLAIGLPGSLTYLGPELRSLNGTLETTLRAVFPNVRPIPGDLNLFLASPEAPLEKITPEILLQRAREQDLQAGILTDTYLRYRLDEGHLRWFRDLVRRGAPYQVNEDLSPTGLLAGLAYWNALFSPEMSPYWSLLGRLSLPPLVIPLILIAGLCLALRHRLAWQGEWPVPMAIAATGIAGMAFDLVVVFAFQSFYGYVYERIGLLIPAFMAGLALGGWLMTQRVNRLGETGFSGVQRGRVLLVTADAAVLGYAVLLPLMLLGLSNLPMHPWSQNLIQLLLLLMNALGGFLVGLEFPVAAFLCLARRGVGRTAGLLYAADLAGAVLGSLAVAAALLPALGIPKTCLLLAALKFLSLALLLTHRPPNV